MCGGVLRHHSGAAFYANDDTVLTRTAEIPGKNIGLGGHGRVYGSVGLRGLSGTTVWRWRLGGCRIFGIRSDCCYTLHASRPLLSMPMSRPAPRPIPTPPNLETVCAPLPAPVRLRHAQRPSPPGLVWGLAPRLEYQNPPHPSGGGDGISRRRGLGALKNTRIASGRRRVSSVRIWGGPAVFLSNNYSQTTTVGAGGVRVILWVQPWAPAGCGQTTTAMVFRRKTT
jgi:hypothetical protein